MIAVLLVVSISMIAGCAGTTEKIVKSGDNVSVDYTGWFDNGTIFDTSNVTVAQHAGIFVEGKAYTPISFIVGAGATISGFDNAVVGMKINESKNVTLTPDQAYGAYNASMILPVPMRVLTQANITPHVNDTLYYNLQPVRVDHIVNNATDMNNSSVYIDFNSPMAGKTLHFTITVRDVQEVKIS
ncbi:MAG TPA: peptidylprolyl isomerase [Methanocellaceae archaeon]|jgi:FKBP-type peptidyl-prolyl cis-trans isomerase 2